VTSTAGSGMFQGSNAAAFVVQPRPAGSAHLQLRSSVQQGQQAHGLFSPATVSAAAAGLTSVQPSHLSSPAVVDLASEECEPQQKRARHELIQQPGFQEGEPAFRTDAAICHKPASPEAGQQQQVATCGLPAGQRSVLQAGGNEQAVSDTTWACNVCTYAGNTGACNR
jgi:hypothetical protein